MVKKLCKKMAENHRPELVKLQEKMSTLHLRDDKDSDKKYHSPDLHFPLQLVIEVVKSNIQTYQNGMPNVEPKLDSSRR